MAKQKPRCPKCGQQTFVIKQTFSLKDSNCHELEQKRFARYQCRSCGCEYLLITPEGKLTEIKPSAK